MVVRLLASSINTRRNKSNIHAKFAVTPHRRSTVLIEHYTQRFHLELGRTGKLIRKKFLRNIQAPSVSGRNQVVRAEERRNPMLLYTTLERNQKFCRRRLRRESNRCLFGWPASFGPRGRGRENKANDGVGVNGSSQQIRRWRGCI
jgi:hypothetical protein